MKLHHRAFITIAALVACLPVAADTIYLLNGRTIHSESVEIRGDQVIVRQFGGTVSIPLSEILRIERDATREQPAESTVPRPATTVAGEPTTGTPVNTDTTGAAPAPSRPSPAFVFDTVVAPYSEADFWVGKLIKVDAQIARVQSELDRLPEYTEAEQRLFRFSGQIMYFVRERDKWDGFMRRLQTQRAQIERSARKAGITPGALRDGLRRQSN